MAGRKVSPVEVEGALVEHGVVNQAAVVGIPDDTTGTVIVAYVVLEDDVDEDDGLCEELRGVVGGESGKPLRPREILFVNEFPRM